MEKQKYEKCGFTKFLYQLLRLRYPYPSRLEWTMWLTNNSGVSERTKHVDIRAHFVRSYVMDEVVTIDFVKSAEDTTNIMTKNQQGIYFMTAQLKLVYTVKDTENTEKKVNFKINEQEEC